MRPKVQENPIFLGVSASMDGWSVEVLSAEQKCSMVSKELYEIKKDLEHYLNTNEEKGVVYIPKFIIEKIVYGF